MSTIKQRREWRARAVAGFLAKPLLPRRVEGKDNYAVADDSGHCRFWNGLKSYGNIQVECRNCVRRPLYTTDCTIEKFLQEHERLLAKPRRCVK